MTQTKPYRPASAIARYIVAEGIDGTGKSTLIRGLAAALKARGLTVVTTEEPTRGVHGRRIRELLGEKSRTLSGEQWLELFEADRREHMDNVVKPALARGDFVLSDRSFYSTAAYQGAQGLDPSEILARNRAFAVEPGLVLILTLAPEESLRRVAGRSRMEADAFERRDFLERVAAIFAAMSGPNIAHVDASLAPAAVLEACQRAVASRLGLGAA